MDLLSYHNFYKHPYYYLFCSIPLCIRFLLGSTHTICTVNKIFIINIYDAKLKSTDL